MRLGIHSPILRAVPRTCRYTQVETRYDRATSAKMAGAQYVIYRQTQRPRATNGRFWPCKI